MALPGIVKPSRAPTSGSLGLYLIPLPSYSPDLNPIEGLWKWMREDVDPTSLLPVSLYQLNAPVLISLTALTWILKPLSTRLWSEIRP